MDCRTGEILKYDDIKESQAKHMVPISETDLPKLNKMAKKRRISWRKNKPCPCGSGLKFKNCCWDKYI